MLLASLALLAAAADAGQAVPAPSPAPAVADRWTHSPSGVSLPRTIDWMTLSQERDMTGRGYDTIVQLGRDGEFVSLYVYRASYPHTRLWFDQSWSVIPARFPVKGRVPEPRTLSTGGVEAGLARAMQLEAGGATGLAVLRSGEWLVKLRVTSANHDAAWVDQQIDRVVTSLSLPQPIANQPRPDLCDGRPPQMTGRRTTDATASRLAIATAPMVSAEVRGRGGLADAPQSYCRMPTDVEFLTMLRPRSGSGWIALLGDSYLATTAFPLPGAGGRVGVTLSTATSTRLSGVFDGTPGFEAAFETAAPLLQGGAGLATISEPDAQPST